MTTPDNVRPIRSASTSPTPLVDTATLGDVRDLIPSGEHIDAAGDFFDDRWDLHGHPDWKAKAGGQTVIDFTVIPSRWRTLAKLWTLASIDPALMYDWLGADHPDADVWTSYKESIKTVTAQANVKALGLGLRRLTTAGTEQVDADGWSHITKLFTQPIDRGEAHTNKRISGTSSKLWADQLRSLHHFGGLIGWADPFGSEPWGEQDLSGVFKVKQAGRKVQLNRVRPTDLVGQTLGIAAFVIDHLADDILAHARWWTTAHRAADPPANDHDGKAATADLIREIARANDGRIPALPAKVGGSDLRVASHSLAYLLGVDDGDIAFQWGRQGLRDAQRTDGTTHTPDLHATPCPLPLRLLPHHETGEPTPWTPRLLWHRHELKWWWSALLYSCAFYLNATLGLRDGDRDLLSPGCVKPKTVTANSGIPVTIHELHAYKQKQRMAPVPTTFVVGTRVQRAVHLVEQMHTILDITPKPLETVGGLQLFDYQLNIGSVRGGRDAIHLDAGYMRWFKGIADRLHASGIVATDGSTLPPQLGEKAVRITTLQAYASRPLGQALAAAFGKWDGSTPVMSGYVGDVMNEIVLPDVEDTTTHAHTAIGLTLRRAADQLDTDDLTGAGIPRLREALNRHPDLANPEPLTRKRAERIGARAQNVETGPYTLCVFQPDGALCGGSGSANFRLCRPGECRNSVMTRADRARLELRRRGDAQRNPVHQRNAAKIAEGLPGLQAEFAGTNDDELVRIIVEDTDGFITDYLDL